jgi:hypothetical protein
MTCYRNGGCGPFEMYSCNVCPASKPEYLQREQPKPKTRADQLRAMTDEELAEWLDNNTYRFPIYKDWLEWLKQEVEE